MNSAMPDRHHIQMLDCTFRDGGYYTGWHFDDALVHDYMAAMRSSRVDLVEVGYVAPVATQCGPFKVDRLDKFDFLPASASLRYCAMLDSKAFLSAADWPLKLRAALTRSADTAIDVIRIASHYSDLRAIPSLVDEIGSLGFRPVLNLMQIDTAGEAEIEKVFNAVGRIEGLEAVYLADSFGSMQPGRVTALVSDLLAATRAPVGFHAHNNMGMALLNSVAAIHAGATWIDSTVAGMGRGAGNTATEELCTLLNGQAPAAMNELLIHHFSALKQQYGWGESILYRIAAQRQLHPMYVQALPTDASRDMPWLARLVQAIPQDRAASFDRRVLEAVLHERAAPVGAGNEN
ncbi:MAG TPA: hypothetical protein VFP68_02805 [Burkholderiaceae bacterium]|nr:hypothetical protein [Burkholderiaceae bacterium]